MSKGKKWFWAGLVSTLILTLIGWNAQVQSQEKYPIKPIDVIIPFAAGGGTDTQARLAAAYLNKKWGVPVNVVNKPGGNTLPANVEVYNAVPNGYTILADSQPSSSMLPIVVKDIPLRIMDRTLISMVCNVPVAFLVPANSPYKTLADIIAEAKRDPENFTWGSLGGSSSQDFMTRQLFKAIGVDVSKTKPVMFKGGALVVAATAGGNIKLGSTNLGNAKAAIQAGLIRPISVTRERNPEFPDVLTTAELGYPTITCVFWVGFTGPPKLPPHIVNIWDKALQEMLKDPEYLSRLANSGFSPFYLNSSGMREYITKEMEEVAELYNLKK